MDIEKKIFAFDEKGYCIAKTLDMLDLDPIDNKMRKAQILEIRNELSTRDNVSETSITSNDALKDEYQIFYDSSRVNIQVICKLSEFVEVVANEKTSSNDRDYIYYRGHSSTNYMLEPSIYRENNKKILEAENIVFRDILSSKPHFFNDCNTTLEKLVKMQHYGIPTRLLDLTENPLIALYFACIGKENNNGEVLFFNIAEDKFKYFDSDTVSVITNIVKCSFDFDISNYSLPYEDREWLKLRTHISTESKEKELHEKYLSKKIQEFNSNLKISELVHFIREDKPYFLDKVNPMHLMNYTLVVKPKMAIDRIINQSGAFVLFGINKKKELHSDCNINKKGYVQKVILIPKEYKRNILSELRMFNINKSTVFGDLDTTAKYFVEKYQ